MALFSSLQDNFNDNSTNLTLWTTFSNPGITVAETGGKVQINIAPFSEGGAGYTATTAYDLTDNQLVFEIPQAAVTPLTWMYIDIVKGPGQLAEISLYDSSISFYYQSGSSYNEVTISYNAVQHRWFRFRHDTGKVWMDTSPDGITWTNRSQNTSTFTPTTMWLEFAAGGEDVNPATVVATFDNFNTVTNTVDITSTISGGGSSAYVSETMSIAISSTISGGGTASYLTFFQALPQKDYEYRVFTHSGGFIGIWHDVTNDFEYEQSINQNASELIVKLGRSPENRTVKQEPLQDHLGANILDHNSQVIYVPTETANAVGPDTDVDHNYNVDVYAFYGGYEALLDHNSNVVTDENGDPILVQFGFPNGKRVYSGYIVDYDLIFGEEAGVEVRVVPHATEMNDHVFKTISGDTTVTYASQDPVTMVRDAMDRYITEGGKMTYTATTMPLTGQVSSYPFKLQTTREVVDNAIELLPVGYYHVLDPSDNTVYLLQKASTPQHIFKYGYHIMNLRLKKSISQLVNDVYFSGGDTGSGTYLYKHYEDTTSQSTYRRGLERLSDSRVTLATSAQTLSQSKINSFKDPRYRTTVVIPDTKYDIESIRLGEMVGFGNTGSFIDNLVLQVVTKKPRKHYVILELDMLIPSDNKRLEEIKRNILSEQIRDIPVAPV
jgi:hypothetical protein